MYYRNKEANEKRFQAFQLTEENKKNIDSWPQWFRDLTMADPNNGPAIVFCSNPSLDDNRMFGYWMKPGKGFTIIQPDYFLCYVVENEVTYLSAIPPAEFAKDYELSDVQEEDSIGSRPYELRDIRTTKREGKWLMAALTMLTTTTHTDKTPDEVLQLVHDASVEMFKKEEKPEVELTDNDIQQIHQTNQN